MNVIGKIFWLPEEILRMPKIFIDQYIIPKIPTNVMGKAVQPTVKPCASRPNMWLGYGPHKIKCFFLASEKFLGANKVWLMWYPYNTFEPSKHATDGLN